jgi:Leucine rich repeat
MVTDDDFDLRMPASSRYEYSNERGERVPQRGGVHRRNSGDRLHPRPPCGSTSPNYITQNTQFNSSCNGSASNSMNCDDYSVHSFSTAGTGMPSSLFYDEGNVPNGGTDLHALDQNGFDADLVAISEYNQRMKNQAQRSSKSPPQNLSSIPPPPMRPAPPPSVNRNRATISAGRGSVKNQENIHYPSSSTTTHLSNPQSGAAKRRKLKVALAVALVVVLVAVVAGVVAGGGGNTASTPVDTDDESALADQPHRLKEVLDFIVREGWTPEKVLQNTTSPQYLAAHWLADLDGRNVQVEGKGEFPSRYALAVLYYATHGQDWRYRINWLTDHDACLWSSTWPGLSGRTIKVGVICPDRTHVVEQLFLPAMDMKGTIPPEIRLLNGLKEIDFYKNNLHGPIPSEIKELHELRSLILHNNDLTGPCPTLFSHNRKLETIDLAMNQLTGSLPTELSKLPALTTLNLEHNKLIGPLEHIRGMPALKHLALGNNALTGPLDGNLLTSWPQITDLDISDNALQGTLPSLLFSIDTLIVLDLHGNDFTGHLPSLVDLEAKIQFLALYENRLSGPIDHRVTAVGAYL